MKKKVIITGATSYIGIALINLLVAKEAYEICAIIRPKSKRINYIAKSDTVRLVECDLGSLDTVVLPQQQYDELYHIGWSSDFSNGRDNYEGQLDNLQYCTKAVQLAYRYHCTTFLGIGSQAECGRISDRITTDTATHPENAYGIVKCKAYEQTRYLCEKYGMKQCWPRLLSAYGPYEREQTLISSCINACHKKKDIELTPCEQIWDYIHVYDVAEALLRIVECGNHGIRYPIASGAGQPLKEYINIISEVGQYPHLLNGIGKKQYSDKQVMYLCGDISELTRDTGFIPRVTFASGIKEIFMLRKRGRL